MIDRTEALRIQNLALEAIRSLTASLDIALEKASPETAHKLKKGVGLSIGTIDTELLSVLRDIYPDLDHLKS
jgi:hypothetical protein